MKIITRASNGKRVVVELCPAHMVQPIAHVHYSFNYRKTRRRVTLTVRYEHTSKVFGVVAFSGEPGLVEQDVSRDCFRHFMFPGEAPGYLQKAAELALEAACSLALSSEAIQNWAKGYANMPEDPTVRDTLMSHNVAINDTDYQLDCAYVECYYPSQN